MHSSTPLATLVVSLLIGQSLAASQATRQENACMQLSQKYPDSTKFPGSEIFDKDLVEPWSQTCQTTPGCVFIPKSAQEVAGGLSILRAVNKPFAVRNQGHMPVPGAADISSGVLLSMAGINTVEYANADKSIIKIGGGNQWRQVYNVTAKDGLAVCGGRFGGVGVSGLLLGGGISYFSSDHGWGANTVKNYELVLANGTICEANTTSNSDLFWALKGGAFNFGIVTRFDMETFPVPYMWGGSASYNGSSLNAIVNAFASYALATGGSTDPAAHAQPTINYNASTGAISASGVYMHRGSDPAPAALKNFTDIPSTFRDFRVAPTVNGLYNDTNPPSFDLGDLRRQFASSALKSTAASVRLINTTFFDVIQANPQIKNVAGLSVTNTFQILTPGMIKAAKVAGGDPIGLEDPNGNGILSALYGASWTNAKDDQTVFNFVQKMIDQLDTNAKAASLYYNLIYMNDGAPTQTKDVFQKLSNGKALPKLRAIAKRYDPDQVFQTLTPGGFKLTNAGPY